ncbi:cytochrome b N-terminal domain-containing protein, partial [Staphylococcus aureus]|uniref:cytochrome b N-terminal domain-containing protein n=1 Tax=Staphylococcus aureus TaxID=1280 RepID=UPI0038B2A35D
MILRLVIIHLVFLHETGSGNPLGVNRNLDKIPFHPYFSYKDLLGFIVAFIGLIIIVLLFPNFLSDPENFIPANPIITPVHIQ